MRYLLAVTAKRNPPLPVPAGGGIFLGGEFVSEAIKFRNFDARCAPDFLYLDVPILDLDIKPCPRHAEIMSSIVDAQKPAGGRLIFHDVLLASICVQVAIIMELYTNPWRQN